MNRLKASLLAASVTLVIAGVMSPAAQTETSIPETPAGIQVRELLGVIDTGDLALIQEFAAARFAPSFVETFGRDRLIDVYYGFFEKYQGLELHAVRESSPQKFVGVFRCRRTGSAFLFGIGVASRPPHRIQGMILLPMTHPDQPESLRSLGAGQKLEMLGSYLDALGRSEVFSGAVLVARNGQAVFQKACGSAVREEGVPNTVETRFNLASLNKMFTAVAVAQLCERGELAYDDLVAKFLGTDWLPEKVSKRVQIRHLLSHTSGIGIGEGDDNALYLEKYVDRKTRLVDQYKPLARGAFLKTGPGKEFSYSNIGFHLLGAVIETVSGQEYDEYVRTRIFGPAGMKETGFDELDGLDSRTARGYVKELKDGTASWRNNASRCNWKGTPAGGAYSTVGDLLKFERALKSDRLVSAKTRDLLFTPKPELGAQSYGFGFSVRQLEGRRKVGHTGGYIGINNSFSMYPENGLTVIILSNIDLVSGSAISDIEFFITGLFL